MQAGLRSSGIAPSELQTERWIKMPTLMDDTTGPRRIVPTAHRDRAFCTRCFKPRIKNKNECRAKSILDPGDVPAPGHSCKHWELRHTILSRLVNQGTQLQERHWCDHVTGTWGTQLVRSGLVCFYIAVSEMNRAPPYSVTS